LGGVNDGNVFSTRGQTLLIKAVHQDTISRLASYANNTDAAYIIPRDDGSVLLGGTYEVCNANCIPNPEVARGILERCRLISPALAQMGNQVQVLRHGVGLRPSRRGGIRIEAEQHRLFLNEITV
jgi:D-amino-acid oxidase